MFAREAFRIILKVSMTEDCDKFIEKFLYICQQSLRFFFLENMEDTIEVIDIFDVAC